MGNLYSRWATRSGRVTAISVTEDGVVEKHRNPRPPGHSFVRALVSPCCGQRSALDSVMDYVKRDVGEAPGVDRFNKRRVFQKRAAGLVAPVYDGDMTWAIPRRNFRAFVDGNIFMTKRVGGKTKEDASSTVTDESSAVSTPSSSKHSVTIDEDPVANANLQTFRRVRKKCGVIDTQVEVEFEDDAAIVPIGYVETPQSVETPETVDAPESIETVAATDVVTSHGVPSAVTVGESGEPGEYEALPEPKLEEPRTIIIPVHPLPLVDAKAGEIPVPEWMLKDGDGLKETPLGFTLPCAIQDPPPPPVVPSPPEAAGKEALAVPGDVASIPVIAKRKKRGSKLLSLRAMLSVDVTLPWEVKDHAHVPLPVRLRDKMMSYDREKTKSAFSSSDVADERKKAEAVSSPSTPHAAADDGCESNKPTVIPILHMGSSDSEEEIIEYFDVDGSKIPKPRYSSGCQSQAALITKKSELSSRSSKTSPKKKRTTKKKRKAKRLDGLVVPVEINVGRRYDAGVVGERPVFTDESDLHLDVVDHVSEGKSRKGKVYNVDDEVEDSEGELEIEYFYPDGSKIPKGSEHHVNAKGVPSVMPANNCSSQAQLTNRQLRVNLSSIYGKWK